jgi:hypothetical protein
MSTLEMCNDEDYKNLEGLANVEEKMIRHINHTFLPLHQLDYRDTSFTGRHLTVLQAFVIANEINRSISFLSQLIGSLNAGTDQKKNHTFQVKHMREFIQERARFGEYWVSGRLNYNT